MQSVSRMTVAICERSLFLAHAFVSGSLQILKFLRALAPILNRKMISATNRCKHVPSRYVRHISFKFWKKGKAEAEATDVAVTDDVESMLLQESAIKSELTLEEELKIRDKSGLTPNWKAYMTSQISERPRFRELKDYKETEMRKFYAHYGKQSGIRPGICWPSKDKLNFVKQYEKTFYPTLGTLFSEVKAEQEAEAKEKAAREKEIEKNLAKLPKAIEEFFRKLDDKEKKLLEEKEKKEKLVQSVREFLGYDIDPKDSRFGEALAKIEEEEKLKKKAKKKEAMHAKLLANLTAMGAEVKTDESDGKKE